MRRLDFMKRWARRLIKDVIFCWLSAQDTSVRWSAKAIETAVAASSLSAVEQGPDF
jgi:hypothetical protein